MVTKPVTPKASPAKKSPTPRATTKKADAPAATQHSINVGSMVDLEAITSITGLVAALVETADELCRITEPTACGTALYKNLELWVAIKTLAQHHSCPFPEELKHNLMRLADFVGNSLNDADEAPITRMGTTLVEINLKIAQGLVEAAAQQMIRETAFRLWEENGCPAGCDREHWLAAEQEIMGMIHAG